MRFKQFMNTLPLDKISHFLAGAVIAAMVQPFGWLYALSAFAFAATGKEFLDAAMQKPFDKVDLVVTVIGGLLMLSWLEWMVPVLQ